MFFTVIFFSWYVITHLFQKEYNILSFLVYFSLVLILICIGSYLFYAKLELKIDNIVKKQEVYQKQEFEKLFVVLESPQAEWNDKVDTLKSIIDHPFLYNKNNNISEGFIIQEIELLGDPMTIAELKDQLYSKKLSLEDLEDIGITIKNQYSF
ncbi:MAG: hypothetical protein M3P22_00975 [bacterium]|nr:hypothetical protein [bacterium]